MQTPTQHPAYTANKTGLYQLHAGPNNALRHNMWPDLHYNPTTKPTAQVFKSPNFLNTNGYCWREGTRSTILDRSNWLNRWDQLYCKNSGEKNRVLFFDTVGYKKSSLIWLLFGELLEVTSRVLLGRSWLFVLVSLLETLRSGEGFCFGDIIYPIWDVFYI